MSPTTPAAAGSGALPFVRVVVLNWNAAWLTERCVRSIRATDYPADRYEIVVVDNASIDGSLARLRADLSGVRFIANEANLGFAEGNNRAMRDLDGVDFVALVNNDATVDPGWLRPLVDALETRPSAGAAAPQLLLETPFSTVELRGTGTITAVEVDGADVTRRCVYDGVIERAHDTVPLAILRSVERRAFVHVPVGSASETARGPVVTIRWQPTPDGTDVSLRVVTHAESGRSDVATTRAIPGGADVRLDERRDRRINSLGTELTPWTEGTERWFGQVVRPNLGNHEVWGFTGGGVLLRAAMLRDVGVFDPRFFAYYEDTDLAWRARRRGWDVVCVPDSVLHHLHGGSAGPEARGFFFLNYRNWLAAVLRNGSPRQVATAFGLARHLSWGPFRRNVFGLARRLRRPEIALTIAWARVFAGIAALSPEVVASRLRRHDRPGSAPTDDVVSRWMPATAPRPPRARAGGPLLVYIDVTETLRSGWRAGIQRVVTEVVRELPNAHPDIELVAVCWSKVHERFRRIDSAEYERLLAPTATQQPARPDAPPSRRRKMLAAAMHASGAAPIVYRVRHRRELAAVPDHHKVLLLDRFEPGSVFLDVDASWNPTTRPRAELLPDLAAGGVASALFVHDLLPQTHREWFIPQLADVSTAHLDAHLDAGSALIANSRFTASTLDEYAAGSAATNAAVVVPMGGVIAEPDTTDAGTPGSPAGPVFVIVGTVEPRKNHTVVLDAFERVRRDHPDARLVVAGRAGWNAAAITDRLARANADANSGVDWRTAVTDAELTHLYRTTTAVVVASTVEGFGLPVVEALAHGAVVLSSTGGALPEAGGDLVEGFDPTSPDELATLMDRHLADPAHHELRRKIAAGYEPTSWSATARAIGDVVLALAGRADPHVATPSSVDEP